GMTRTILIARCGFERSDNPKRTSRGLGPSTPTAPPEDRKCARQVARARSAPEGGWQRYADGIGGELPPCRMRFECSRASAECVDDAFRQPRGAAGISGRTLPTLPATAARGVPFPKRA